jgi:hypothetical protein
MPARVHAALIGAPVGAPRRGHIARDATESEARDKPAKTVAASPRRLREFLSMSYGG